jgi:hypothetical protein
LISASQPTEISESPPRTPVIAQDSSGNTFRHLGIAVTLVDSTWSLSVFLNNSGYRTGSGRESYEQVRADEGTKFVTVATRVLNDGKKSIDLACSRPVAAYLLDDQDRKFDPIKRLYRVRGNPECNYNLQPGFSCDMNWIFHVPLDAGIRSFQFEDARDLGRDRTIRPVPIPVMPRPVADLWSCSLRASQPGMRISPARRALPARWGRLAETMRGRCDLSVRAPGVASDNVARRRAPRVLDWRRETARHRGRLGTRHGAAANCSNRIVRDRPRIHALGHLTCADDLHRPSCCR